MIQDEKFSILNYIDRLTPAKEKGRYICPVCGGGNLTINKTINKKGAYGCWNGCRCEDIREAIATGSVQHNKQVNRPATSANHQKNNQLTTKVPIPATATIKLAKLPTPAEIPQLQQQHNSERGEVWEIKYFYSATQWVHRTEWLDATKAKGRDKKTLPYHVTPSGQIVCAKGDAPWLPYRIDEAETHGFGKWVAMVEGEKCVEYCRWLGLVAITLQGGSWTDEALRSAILQLKRAGVAGVVCLPDHDKTGREKAEKVVIASNKAEMPLITIDPLALWEDMPEAGDIADWVKWGSEQGMNQEDFIRRLEEELHRAVAVRIEEQRLNDPDERLKLALIDLLSETDSVKRLRKRAEICSYYRISKGEVEETLKELKQQTTTAKPLVFRLDEFLSQTSEALEFVVPGMLPVGETALLVGTPGCGKTLLAIDLAFAVATGESDFLGETVQQGRVLLISADESPNSTRTKLLKRGFRQEDADNLRVIPNFDMTQLGVLEQELEDFRPTLVIVDSLRRINHGGNVSENSAEFADSLYTLKELLQRYKAAGVIIHHCGKSKEAVGVDKVRGSGAIAGAVWGVWSLEQIVKIVEVDGIKKPSIDPRDPNRIFNIPKARDFEGQTLRVELDPENLHWLNNGSGESPEVLAELRTRQQKILELLKQYSPKGLEGSEIRELLGVDKSIYSDLNRLVAKRQVTQRPAQRDKRRTVYALPNVEGDSLPPTPYVSDVIQFAETHTQQGLQDRSQMDRDLLTNGSQDICDPSTVIHSNPGSATILEIDHSLEADRGGEGVPTAPDIEVESLPITPCVPDAVQSAETVVEQGLQNGSQDVCNPSTAIQSKPSNTKNKNTPQGFSPKKISRGDRCRYCGPDGSLNVTCRGKELEVLNIRVNDQGVQQAEVKAFTWCVSYWVDMKHLKKVKSSP